MKETDGCILRTSLDDLDNAYTKLFNKTCRAPRYKSKNNHESYRTVCIRNTYKDKEYANIKLSSKKRTIKLLKIDEIKIRGYKNLTMFPHKILNATVTKEAGKYYVSVCVEEEICT